MHGADGLWVFLIVCVCVSAFVKIVRMRSASRQSGVSQSAVDELSTRIASLEKRMSNIETIVLDSEKHKAFERQL